MPSELELIAQFEDDLKRLEQELIKKIEASLTSGISRSELARLYAEINFFDKLIDLGYDSMLDDYFSNYDEIVKNIIQQAQQRGVDIAGVSAYELDALKQVHFDFLLGKAETFGNQLKSRILQGIITGTPTNQLVQQLSDIPLKDYQLTVAINSGYAEFESASTGLIFESKPEQKFILFGPDDERTRASCLSVLRYQPKEGFTKKEIDEGAWTRLVTEHAQEFAENISQLGQAFKNDYSFNWRGGFNCRHRGRPL